MYATMMRDSIVLLLFILDYIIDAHPRQGCKIPNGDGGSCTVLSECRPLYDLHKKSPKSPKEDLFIRQSVGSCSSRGSKIKVCCPPTSQWDNLVVSPVMYPEKQTSNVDINEVLVPVHGSVENRLQDTLPPPLTLNVPVETAAEKLQKWFQSHKNTETCGVVTNTEKIVGGDATAIDEYPWLALLEYQPKKFWCGGSLISRSHVLTAAHCLYNPPSQVRLSEFNLTSEPTDVVEVNGNGKDYITVKIVKVDWTLQHPDHAFKTSINDIGIIKMKEEVEYGDFIKPICLPTMDYRNTIFNVDTNFTVAGWGSENRFLNSEVKRSVSVPYVPTDICSETYPTLQVKQLLCAGGEEGKDSCRGDSGGPLMYLDSSKLMYVIVGIVSSGDPNCGAKDRPGLYTYVYLYVDWIKNTIRDEGNN